MTIVHALWDDPATAQFERIKAGVMIAVAEPSDPELLRIRIEGASRAAERLPRAEVKLFEGAPHDIHVDRPVELADWILDALRGGFFDAGG
jgi:pimeloyl-ACP methyl ester carboxylesterase